MKKILLTTTSFQDTPGEHHNILNSAGFEIIRERGPLSEERMLELAGDFDAFLCGDDAITRAVIDKSLPKLQVISKYGIGLDKIDVKYATEKKIPITFCPGVNHTTVAEHTFALLLALVRKLTESANETSKGNWKRMTGNEIMGKTIGIVGLGRIGKEVAIRANAFGMKVLGYDIYWDEEFARKHNVQRVESLPNLFPQVDVLTLHTNLSEETRDLINVRTLSVMRDGVLILNCARGEIVKTQDIVEGLKSGKVGGYGTDVLDQEPPPANHPLLTAPNTIVTPHIGSRTYESVVRQATMAVNNLILALKGEKPLAQANDAPLPGQTSAKATPPQPTISKPMSEKYYIIPTETHNKLVRAAYQHRGYTAEEAEYGAQFAALAAEHGIRTHNALKALHLDHLFGSAVGGCVPNVSIKKQPARFAASQAWDANKKLGQAVAYEAMDACMEMADKYGIAQVAVDNTFHYLWGGGYALYASQKGYIAYTNCTSTLAEVVPFGGKTPTLGTNPHTWAFPTTSAIGYDILIDWATSVVAMGRVQQFKRENKELPPNAAVDADGNPTTDPHKAKALLPFGAHKGYGLSLINEIMGGLIGGSLPTIRGHHKDDDEKQTTAFYFQVIHPDALIGGTFAKGRSQSENLKAVIDDILGGGNTNCLLPGQIEATFAKRTEKAGGLLFTENEIFAFNEIAEECGQPKWDIVSFESE